MRIHHLDVAKLPLRLQPKLLHQRYRAIRLPEYDCLRHVKGLSLNDASIVRTFITFTWPAMNNADHWLNYLVSEDVVLARSRVKGSWGVRLEQTEGAYFHFVGEGTAYVQVDGEPEIALEPGDLVVFPQGAPHHLRGVSGGKTLPLHEFVGDSQARNSKDPDATGLLCGSFGIARYMTMPAVKSLPAIMHLQAHSQGTDAPFVDTLRQLCDEVENIRMGSDVVVRHLLSTLFVYVLRHWSETHPVLATNWLSALQNRHIATALACIHRDPAGNWTIDGLAREAGLSRSLFARQFHETVGETPHLYLTRWRIGIAVQLLNQTDITIAELAEKIGYRSEYSFIRAFRQMRGITPTQHRAARLTLKNEPVAPCAHAVPFHASTR
ncbi:AraC family transcriptional regulator [Pseudomonas sp. NPDC090208]|uniref:AraC family transcriptional regulator n=1 Tax=Pseudomonas sp. NPDC090208 TaxID=3364478 RepID=UPI00382FD333